MKNHLILGDWNALCDSCGRKFKASSLQKRWDGLIVCREDWEQRHPQDLLRVQREQISVPWSRPYPAEDTYLPWNYSDTEKDYLGLVETLSVNFQKVIQDVIGNSGALNGNLFNQYAVNANVTSSPATETFILSETFFAALARFLTDTVSVSETFVKRTYKVFADTVPIGESWRFTETEHNADSLSLSESITTRLNINRTLTDTLSITESIAKAIKPTLSDSASITETYVNAPNKKPTDSLSLAETSRFTINKTISETLSVSESVNAALPVAAYLNGSELNLTTLG
jgi:hypothetical protein